MLSSSFLVSLFERWFKNMFFNLNMIKIDIQNSCSTMQWGLLSFVSRLGLSTCHIKYSLILMPFQYLVLRLNKPSFYALLFYKPVLLSIIFFLNKKTLQNSPKPKASYVLNCTLNFILKLYNQTIIDNNMLLTTLQSRS